MMIEWNSRLETGIAAVDDDHRGLVRLINQLDDMLAARADLVGIGVVIDAVIEFAEHHFLREEEMMVRLGYPDSASHGANHAGFSHRLGARLAGCMIDPSPDSIGSLQDHLQSWLVDHILTEDMRFAEFLRQHQPPP